MPHREHNQQELDVLFPSLKVPDDCDFEDLIHLEKDYLYEMGMTEIQSILDQMSTTGRTRKPPCAPEPLQPGTLYLTRDGPLH